MDLGRARSPLAQDTQLPTRSFSLLYALRHLILPHISALTLIDEVNVDMFSLRHLSPSSGHVIIDCFRFSVCFVVLLPAIHIT